MNYQFKKIVKSALPIILLGPNWVSRFTTEGGFLCLSQNKRDRKLLIKCKDIVIHLNKAKPLIYRGQCLENKMWKSAKNTKQVQSSY